VPESCAHRLVGEHKEEREKVGTNLEKECTAAPCLAALSGQIGGLVGSHLQVGGLVHESGQVCATVGKK